MAVTGDGENIKVLNLGGGPVEGDIPSKHWNVALYPEDLKFYVF